MPLKLSLRPGEKFVVNGAVVQNGDRRAALVLQNKASVLREKDIMQPDEADSGPSEWRRYPRRHCDAYQRCQRNRPHDHDQ